MLFKLNGSKVVQGEMNVPGRGDLIERLSQLYDCIGVILILQQVHSFLFRVRMSRST